MSVRAEAALGGSYGVAASPHCVLWPQHTEDPLLSVGFDPHSVPGLKFHNGLLILKTCDVLLPYVHLYQATRCPGHFWREPVPSSLIWDWPGRTVCAALWRPGACWHRQHMVQGARPR